MVLQSMLDIFSSLTRLPPKPESMSALAIVKKIARTPTVPKSSGVKSLANTKLDTN